MKYSRVNYRAVQHSETKSPRLLAVGYTAVRALSTLVVGKDGASSLR